MDFIGWTYDIAREQSPSEDQLRELIRRSGRAGYNAMGLYLEHRFAYPSAPWAAGPGALTPEVVKSLGGAAKEAGVRLIPFLNTLGHMEGFIRSEGGGWLAESSRDGVLQLCPSREECTAFALGLVNDAIDAFDDEWVHLGGDEAYQLGECPECAARAEAIGKEGLYAEFFGKLCRHVLERGRRPCLWGDMLAKYPGALEGIPRETVIFDWNYERPPVDTAKIFRERGFEVVCCPAIRSYDAGWCFLEQTQRVIDGHADAAREEGAAGVCVCSWEFFGFSSFASVLPLIMAAGRRVSGGAAWAAALEEEGGAAYARAAEILGSGVPGMSSFLAPGIMRSLREPLALRSDPFALWRDWRREIEGDELDGIFEACGEALRLLEEDSPLRFPLDLHRAAVMWVRYANQASGLYSAGRMKACAGKLMAGHEILAGLGPGLERIAEEGGSGADLLRLDRALDEIERACARIRELAEDGWRPAFETITQKEYISGDQAAWRTVGRPPGGLIISGPSRRPCGVARGRCPHR